MTLRIPRSFADEIIRRAREHAPDECWGMLAGEGERVQGIFHLENGAPPDEKPFRYETEFRSQAAAERSMVQQGWDVLGIYHSHTHTQPYPSPTDIERANPLYGDIVYLIVSLRYPGQPFVFRGMSDAEYTDRTVEEMAERIRRLEDELREARAELDRHKEDPRWYESGEIHPELDDQTIVPPG